MDSNACRAHDLDYLQSLLALGAGQRCHWNKRGPLPSSRVTYHIGHQVSVQVWRDHDVKLVRPGHKLHACVVHNHLLSLRITKGITGRQLNATGNESYQSAITNAWVMEDLHRGVRAQKGTLMEGYFCATLLNSCRNTQPCRHLR